MQELLKKLESIHFRFLEVGNLIVDPTIISDMDRYVKLNKEYKDLEPVDNAYKEYKDILSNLESVREILDLEKDGEMREMAKMELDDLETRRPVLEEEIKLLLNFELVPVEMKLVFSLKISLECIPCFSKSWVGNTKY
jgi:peptide chain release factor 1